VVAPNQALQQTRPASSFLGLHSSLRRAGLLSWVVRRGRGTAVGQSRRRLLQHLAVFLALPLAPLWLLFAVVNYPLIVPADSNFGLVASREQAAIVGVGMALLSVVSMLWAAGVFGRATGNWGCALVLLGCLVLAGLTLYPSIQMSAFSSMALSAYVVGVVVVLLGRAGSTHQDAEPGAAADRGRM
jgi:hypothetical protein